VAALLAPSPAAGNGKHTELMRVLISALVLLSGTFEGVAIPIAIRDSAAPRRALDVFNRRPGAQSGTAMSLFKAREAFLSTATCDS
jgi:hypothetical protein